MNTNSNLILNTLGVPIIYDLESLSEQLSITKTYLYMLSRKQHLFYETAQIPKKDGSMRKLHAPVRSLKVVQKWILVEILEKVKVSPYAMAFVPGKNGLKENALLHKDRVFILEMDIHDFFGSITQRDVFHLFTKIGYNYTISAILANLCTYEGVLPQGAVTSPYIANLICYNLDMRLGALCNKRDIVYTRYADDLSFSSDNRTRLNRIERLLKEIVRDEGFEINDKKTRYFSNDRKKTVTGITINDREIHADRKLKQRIRSKIFHAVSEADYSEAAQIRGLIAFVDSIEDGYRDQMACYMEGLALKKELRRSAKVVRAYNENKLFRDLEDMIPL